MQKNIPKNKKLTAAVISLLITLIAFSVSGYAWYIYNTGRYTTTVRMAAGTGASLKISREYTGAYSSAVELDSFFGLNPVSTNRISGGFQKVYGFTNGSENMSKLVASLFGKSKATDYYRTSLYLRTNADSMDVYLADIGFEDDDSQNPISTAIRVGIVVHEPGLNQPVAQEFIFAINDADNPEADYNTATGMEGWVLDCTKTDGTTVPFQPLTSVNYCSYNSSTGVTTITENSKKLLTLAGDQGRDGTPVEVEIYIWLEGCDKDCTNNLCSKSLKNVAFQFAGYAER